MGCLVNLAETAKLLRSRGVQALTYQELTEKYYEIYYGGTKIPRQVTTWVFKSLPSIVKVFKTNYRRYSCDLVVPFFFQLYKKTGEPPQTEAIAKECIPMGNRIKANGLWFGTGDKHDLIHVVTRAHNIRSGLGKFMVGENDCIDGVEYRGEDVQDVNLFLRKEIQRFEPKDINHPALKGIHDLIGRKGVKSDAYSSDDEEGVAGA